MLYTLLPVVNNSIIDNLECITSDTVPKPFISNSLSFFLYNIKNHISKYGDEWEEFRKYTNPYEYINSNVPTRSKCVSKYKPLSRSYFKLLEIMFLFDLYKPNNGSAFETANVKLQNAIPISSFHLAEGPGGFIEAIANIRKNPNDKYIGMTILDDANDWNIPAWKKSDLFLKNNPNVFIENCVTGTGDILCIQNFKHCIDKYGSSMDLITADGGFDFSTGFNSQEINIIKLLYGQICYALCLQKHNGNFILKIFDWFMNHTVDLLYILSSFYQDVYITKPNTSRYANSEKYIVCKKFIFTSNVGFISKLTSCFVDVLNSNTPIYRFLNYPIASHFINKIEEFNAIFGRQQIDNIQQTISLIDSKNNHDKIESYIRNNIQKCTNWCITHNIPHNILTRNSWE
jgi:23S rRNA U2552 (ribose-2'-O)-methylase RlmE/FtsJ